MSIDNAIREALRTGRIPEELARDPEGLDRVARSAVGRLASDPEHYTSIVIRAGFKRSLGYLVSALSEPELVPFIIDILEVYGPRKDSVRYCSFALGDSRRYFAQEIFQRWGPGRRTVRYLLDSLKDGKKEATAREILVEYGPSIFDHVDKGFEKREKTNAPFRRMLADMKERYPGHFLQRNSA